MPDVVFPLLSQRRSASTFQPLTCVFILSSHQASLLLTQSKNNPFGLTLKVFFTLYLARKLFLMPHSWIFAVFLYSRTPKGNPNFIRPDVCILGSGVFSRESAPCVWPSPLLIRTLASCALSSPTLVVGGIGTELTFLVTQPLICWLSSILSHSGATSGLVSPPCRLFLFFLASCFCFPDTLTSVFSFRPFHRLRYSSLLEIKLSSRLYSFPVIEVVISGKSRHLSWLLSRTTMDSCLTMFGARPYGMVRLTFLECVDTLTPPSALSEQLKLTWRLRKSLLLANPVDICFVPLIIKGHSVDTPLLSSTTESRFRKYPRDSQIDSGETLHSFRSSCALTLAFSGFPLADVMSHVGWSTSKTALYLLKLADVIRAGAPVGCLRLPFLARLRGL